MREWLSKGLEREDRKAIGEDIKDVEFAWPIGVSLGSSAWSRVVGSQEQLAARRIARVLFRVTQERMVLLHGFLKKTKKTPKHDLDLVLKPKKGSST